MKNMPFLFFAFLFLFTEINSQTVTGKLVDENSAALAGVQLQLYASPNVYTATSDTSGIFSFNIITDVEDTQLPTGYSVSDNFPNPFNPRTRIDITLPNRENVKVEVFNLLGQSVADVIDQTYDAGTNHIDIELNGLPNGFYISRITIGEKYTVVKKLMLIYGSQHINADGGVINVQLNKSKQFYLETILDSLVATSTIFGRKTFTSLPNFVSGVLDLGNLTIERYCPGTPTVLYEGKTYNTVMIGSQCWLKENLDVGTMINSTTRADSMKNNGLIEKYCYDNNPNNCTTYGGLYQWDETMQYVTNEGAKGICPIGWHIPTLAEFQTLKTAVNDNGNSLKAVEEGSGSGAGTNTSGFSALLAGYCYYNGGFTDLGGNTGSWSSTELDATDANFLLLWSNYGNIYLHSSLKDHGLSVRCIKN